MAAQSDIAMLVRFWGTRGSLPVAITAMDMRNRVRSIVQKAASAGSRLNSTESIERFIEEELSFAESGTYGGHSSCVELIAGEHHIICDAGSGLRALGNDLMNREGPTGHTIHLFLSHLHWDHIMGFPFFTPAYLAGNHVHVYGCHDGIEEALRRQQRPPGFPVSVDTMNSTLDFHQLRPGEPMAIGDVKITASAQRHGGDSYGYRFDAPGGDGVRSVVYSTDGEHKLETAGEREAIVAFYKQADLVIFDAMYSLAETVSVKEDWGHSSNIVGVDLCLEAEVKHYCMFHHEPMHDDAMIERILAETRRYEELSRQGEALAISAAYDRMEIEV